MMKKRIFSLVLVGLMFALSACTSNVPDNNNTKDVEKVISEQNATGKSEEPELTVGQLAVGDVAPDVEFTLMDGTTAKLSDYKGKPVLINFWATWCGYCVEEMPALQMLKDKYGDDITILALNAGGDTEEDIKAFAEDNNYTFDFAIISNDEANKYNVQSIPATYIIDSDGNISYTITGAYDADTMFNDYYAPEIDKLLNK